MVFERPYFNRAKRKLEVKEQSSCHHLQTWPGIVGHMADAENNPISYSPDSAAIFASAMALWKSCNKAADMRSLNLSECFSGVDQFMREVMRTANFFESWACTHVLFDEVNDVWPYLLQARFGEAYLEIAEPENLASFNDADCLRIAMRLRPN